MIETLPRTISLAEWDEVVSHQEGVFELVAGIPTMSPGETGWNIDVAFELAARIRSAAGAGVRALPNYGVRTIDGTVRQPDLVVLGREVDISAARVDAEVVDLVVEVVSPDSIERDWITKRHEYAAAGIPLYLVIDDAATTPTLTLFTLDDATGTYSAPAGGSSVELVLSGEAITITSEALRRRR